MTTSDTFLEQVEATLRDPMSPSQRAVLDARVGRALATPQAPRKRRVRIGRSVLLAAASFVMLPAFAVGVAILNTEDPYGLASAQEFSAELEAAKAAVPLPGGRAWPAHLTVQDGSGSYSRGGARSWVESNAVCIWFDDWLTARADGDQRRAAVASAAIAGIPNWPSWNSLFWTKSVRDHLTSLIADVAAQREQPIREDIARNCGFLLAEE